MKAGLAGLALLAGGALAQDQAGDFDYWVLSLSWSPSYCAREGDARGDEQCAPGANPGFIVHGLWPQYERGGWPQFCQTAHPPPSRRETRAMADIMGASGLAWHAWRKHGTCSGLSASDYFALTRDAAERAAPPEVFARISRDIGSSVRRIEAAFATDHPDLRPDHITVTCRDGALAEARICLDKDLRFRECGRGAARDCRDGRMTIPSRR